MLCFTLSINARLKSSSLVYQHPFHFEFGVIMIIQPLLFVGLWGAGAPSPGVTE